MRHSISASPPSVGPLRLANHATLQRREDVLHEFWRCHLNLYHLRDGFADWNGAFDNASLVKGDAVDELDSDIEQRTSP